MAIRSLLFNYESEKRRTWWRPADHWLDESQVRIRTRQEMKVRLMGLLKNDITDMAESSSEFSKQIEGINEALRRVLIQQTNPSSVLACQLCAEAFPEINSEDSSSSAKESSSFFGRFFQKNIDTIPEEPQQRISFGTRGQIKCTTCLLVICEKCSRLVPLPSFRENLATPTTAHVCLCCDPLIKAIKRDILVETQPSRETSIFFSTLWFNNRRFQQIRQILEKSFSVLKSSRKMSSSSSTTSFSKSNTLTASNLHHETSSMKSGDSDGIRSPIIKKFSFFPSSNEPDRHHWVEVSKCWHDVKECLSELQNMIPSKVNPKSNAETWSPKRKSELTILGNVTDMLKDCYSSYQEVIVSTKSGDSSGEKTFQKTPGQKAYINRMKLERDSCIAAYCLIRQLYLEFETARSLKSDVADRRLRQLSIALSALEQAGEVQLRSFFPKDTSWDLCLSAAGRLVQERTRSQPLFKRDKISSHLQMVSSMKIYRSNASLPQKQKDRLSVEVYICLKLIINQLDKYCPNSGNEILRGKLKITLNKCLA